MISFDQNIEYDSMISGNFHQDMSPETRLENIRTLPFYVRKSLQRRLNKSKEIQSKHVSRAITRVISKSSVTQGAKGVLTAGVIKAAIYSFQKANKFRKGYFLGN